MGTVRIISGTFKNARLEVPASAHPMGERERIAIFNSLAPKIPGATVLDAFAGSGALGLESLSRGAQTADFLECDPRTRTIIRNNAEKLNVGAKVTVFGSLGNFEEGPHNYDLIFADPPYTNPQLETLKNLIKFLHPSGTFILSLPKELPPPTLPGLAPISDKTYARARILMYASRPSNCPEGSQEPVDALSKRC